MEFIVGVVALLAVVMIVLVAYLVVSVRRLHRRLSARVRLRELAALDHLSPDPQPPELHVVRACDAVVARPAGSPWASVRVTPAALGLVGAATVFVLSSSGVGAPVVVQPNAALPPTTAQIPLPTVDTTPPPTTPVAAPIPQTQSSVSASNPDDPVRLQVVSRSSAPSSPPSAATRSSQSPSPRQDPPSPSSTSTAKPLMDQPLPVDTPQVPIAAVG